MGEVLRQILEYASKIDFLEAGGLIFGLLCVWFLIKDNILTWPSGIIYVLISFVIFWRTKLYADFGLHFVFLALNIYGWYYWIKGGREKEAKSIVPITTINSNWWIVLIGSSAISIYIMGKLLSMTDAAVPYWDSTTTVLSIAGRWLTARKKIENWHFWFVVDVIATGVYVYKEIYFYALLYLLYIGMAVAGYLSWKKIMNLERAQLKGSQ